MISRTVALVATFYMGDTKLVIIPNLLLIAAGSWLTLGYLRDLDRSR